MNEANKPKQKTKKPTQKAAGKIKAAGKTGHEPFQFTTVAWGWMDVPEDVPTPARLEKIITDARALGYEGIDLLATYEALDTFYLPQICQTIGDFVYAEGLFVGGVAFQSNLWNTPDKQVQDKQIEYFTKCAEAASLLGAGMISCIIPGPYGAKPNRKGSPSEKIATNLPADYNWFKDWGLFVSMLKTVCTIAQEKELKVALECFPGSLCSTPHAMLEIVKHVKKPNFGIQLDTAHLANQRIDIETAIHMLGDSILNVHAKDSDGMTRGNLPAGSGTVDYIAVMRALRNIGYKGSISAEVEFTDDPYRYMGEAISHLRWCQERLALDSNEK